MYKPGTQLVMNEIWAAAAAHKLGFEMDSNPNNSEYVIQNDMGWVQLFLPDARVWRITVTESGPNAAKRFLPQVDDVLRGFSMPDKYAVMISKDFMSEWLRKFSAVKIIERNGIPFPQFSEVIKP
jgi:hypothetical protein